jgi:diacylglycerol kinase (ATP)
MARSALFLVNSNASGGQFGVDALREVLIAGGLSLVDPPADQSHDLSVVIRNHQDRVDMVIVGGGDGTLHRALEGLVATKLPLGILPLGTANDFVRTLKLPTEPLEACSVILQGRLSEIDLGEVNGKLFCNVASIGLKRESKSQWGVLAYLFAALKSLWHSQKFHAEIEGDSGHFSVRTVQVTVGNGRSYGGGLTVDESATAEDGLLHLFSLEVDRWWQIIPLVPAMWNGRLHSTPQVRTFSGDWFHIRTPNRAETLTADGEFVCSTPIRFRCLPRAFKVFTLPAK